MDAMAAAAATRSAIESRRAARTSDSPCASSATSIPSIGFASWSTLITWLRSSGRSYPSSGYPTSDGVRTIAAHVAAATTVAQLGRFGDRIDALVSDEKLTADEWSRLTDAIAARHQEIEPAQEVASND